ncbi:aldo/keto reductase [Mesorhizobium sp.]|uniref:aldo/keto reductase n=1 Tax=Mesorhizobium sp. TaxID=1871066 RepID=UPI000FE72A6C|nr:aldo/keto reductase [Mesorhizobium sp.]RWE79556.1 MAG: aldo/keto reductase [Mesorhizobium sp.]
MSISKASKAGQFKIGDFEINRFGFGAMRIVGKGTWGEPEDRAEVKRTLQRLPELGINFIDTADSYGPDVSEELIRDALHPYSASMLIATKAGLTRQGPDQWAPVGRPEYLIQQVHKSLRNLKVDVIDLWQLHRIDGQVPQDEQFDAVKSMVKGGLIKNVGLSEVSTSQIEAAQKYFKVVTVQNRYNLVDRAHEDVLDYCEKNGIGFIPWFPLAAGSLAKKGSVLDQIASRHTVAPSAVALAWILRRSPVMLPIPGTGKVAHLEENLAAVGVELTDAEFAELDVAGKAA